MRRPVAPWQLWHDLVQIFFAFLLLHTIQLTAVYGRGTRFSGSSQTSDNNRLYNMIKKFKKMQTLFLKQVLPCSVLHFYVQHKENFWNVTDKTSQALQ